MNPVRAPVRFLLNGEPVSVEGAAPQTTLLEYLRDARRLMGAMSAAENRNAAVIVSRIEDFTVIGAETAAQAEASTSWLTIASPYRVAFGAGSVTRVWPWQSLSNCQNIGGKIVCTR